MKSDYPRVSRLALAILKPIHWLFVTFYFRVHVHGAERLPKGVPLILTPTHRSMWDSFFIKELFGKPPHYLVNVGNFKGLQGFLLARMGCIPVNLGHPSHHALRQCTQVVESGQPLVIFPEATIYYYPPNHVHVPLSPGAAWVSLIVARDLGQKPPMIVPIRLNYSHLQLRFRSRVDVHVLEPIDSAPFVELPKKQGRQQLTDLIRSRLGDVENPSVLEEFPATEFLKQNRRKNR